NWKEDPRVTFLSFLPPNDETSVKVEVVLVMHIEVTPDVPMEELFIDMPFDIREASVCPSLA
ncbi:hypothetical protein BDN67DRAFT_1012376, partial [Paxillus ammoniavirescens]